MKWSKSDKRKAAPQRAVGQKNGVKRQTGKAARVDTRPLSRSLERPAALKRTGTTADRGMGTPFTIFLFHIKLLISEHLFVDAKFCLIKNM